jgi:hypothetical protein
VSLQDQAQLQTILFSRGTQGAEGPWCGRTLHSTFPHFLYYISPFWTYDKVRVVIEEVQAEARPAIFIRFPFLL